MYSLPHLYGAQHQLCRVNNVQIQYCQEECTAKGVYPCDTTVFHLCCILMEESYFEKPSNASEAMILYDYLRENILAELARI